VPQPGADGDLDAALAALIEAALRGAAATESASPAEQARLVARTLAVGLRELVRAPLREALQAGYDLGWRAALDAHARAAATPPLHDPPPAPCAASAAPSPAAPATLAPLAAMAADAASAAHQVCVEVSPLPNFSAVNRFHAAVAGAPDVADTTMVAFRDGRLTLQVEHPDGRALAAALRALDVGRLRVLAATVDRLELALESHQPTANSRQPAREGRRRPSPHR